jgi:hypothetical protein
MPGKPFSNISFYISLTPLSACLPVGSQQARNAIEADDDEAAMLAEFEANFS